MKLSELKQNLLNRNNQLPEIKRWTSSVREEYQENLNNEPTLYIEKPIKVKESDISLPSVSTYNRTEEVLNLNNQFEKIDQEAILPSITNNESKIDKVKIIGITGSRGKSSTAFIVHEYLKSIGKKSILYSSIRIDSPASFTNINEPCEVPIQSENVLLDIITEAEAYETEYIVLEVNESSIKKGLIKDIPFSVRALTNISPYHNEEQYSPQEYVRLKESFFENIPDDEDSTCVIGLTDYISRDDFNKLLKLNTKPKLTYSSKEICEDRNALYTNLDLLLYNLNSDINGTSFKLRVKENTFDIKSKSIFSHNALNFTCAAAILEALNLFSYEVYSKCISEIEIPGREEVIRVNDRTIVIGLHLFPILEQLKEFQRSNQIGKIKVVVGSMGSGFITWGKEFSSELYMSKRGKIRKFAMDYLTDYADFAYITSNDNASENPLSIAEELVSYINEKIPSRIIIDRKEAIKEAIKDSDAGDLIYITGRGNRRIFCDTKTTMKLFLDKEVVIDELARLGW